jgi:type I restriction enzyme S subunit
MPSINTKLLATAPILLPSIGQQNHAAKILDQIETKIELNRKMNETLEQMGQALFRHYFIDNPEAKKWDKKSLSEQVEILSGGTPKTSEKSYWGGDIPWFSVVDAPAGSDLFTIRTSKNITEAGLKNSAAKLIPKRTTIISARGTVGKLALAGREMTINQSCYALRSDTPFYTYLTINHCLSDIKSRVHGSVFDTITRNTFDQLSFSAPPATTLNHFEDEIEPLFLQILNNVEEIQTLTTLRNTLLPRLINGKVRVGE